VTVTATVPGPHTAPGATFQRLREPVNAGLRAAKSRGVQSGRPSTVSQRRGEILELREAGVGLRETARGLKMPASSVAKVLGESKLDAVISNPPDLTSYSISERNNSRT
jgi:DNA invertase Pin-like site-specific DNA recombinase